MYSSNRYNTFSPVIISLIRKKAQNLIQHQGFLAADLEDIEQELIFTLLNKLVHFDTNKSSLNSFAKRVIDNKARDLLRYKFSQKRHCLIKSVTAIYDDDNSQFSIDYIADIAYDEKIRQLEQKIDFTKLTHNLPVDLLNLFNLLQKMNISEIAKIKNISRKKLYKDLQKLKTYLQKSDFI